MGALILVYWELEGALFVGIKCGELTAVLDPRYPTVPEI